MDRIDNTSNSGDNRDEKIRAREFIESFKLTEPLEAFQIARTAAELIEEENLIQQLSIKDCLPPMEKQRQIFSFLDELSSIAKNIEEIEGGRHGLYVRGHLAVLYHFAGDTGRALEYLTEVEAKVEKEPPCSRCWLLAQELAPAYARIKHPEKVLELVEKSAEVERVSEDRQSKVGELFDDLRKKSSNEDLLSALVPYLAGEIMALGGSIPERWSFKRKAIEKIKDPELKLSTQIALAEAHLKVGDLKSAGQVAAEAAQTLGEHKETPSTLSWRYCRVGTILARAGSFHEAAQMWVQAVEELGKASEEQRRLFRNDLILARKNATNIGGVANLVADLKSAHVGSSIQNLDLWKIVDAALFAVERELGQ